MPPASFGISDAISTKQSKASGLSETCHIKFAYGTMCSELNHIASSIAVVCVHSLHNVLWNNDFPSLCACWEKKYLSHIPDVELFATLVMDISS